MTYGIRASGKAPVDITIPGIEDEAALWEQFPQLRPRRRIARRLLPWVAVGCALAGWYAMIRLFRVPPYILPLPHTILTKIIGEYRAILTHAGPTILESILGFAAATAFGVVCAICMVAWRPVGEATMPLLVFSQTTPKVAIAPLFLLWFGFGYLPKVIVSFLIAFFPIVIAMAAGLESAPRELVELVHSLSGRKVQVFVKVRIPASLPFFFSGLKIAITLAVIGALVGEFVGSDKGLGYLILNANADVDSGMLLAVVVVLSVIGYLMFYGICLIERTVMPWHTSIKTRARVEYTY